MIIGTEIFKGIRPKIAPQLLGLAEAQDAKDCNLKYGDLRPFLGPDPVISLTDDLTYLTLYRYLGSHWFAWQSDVDIVSGPIANDTNRRYYTGDGIPKKTNQAEATTGSGDKPINFYPLGVPVPTDALTATATDSGGSGDDRDAVYVWTIRTAWGEEGKPSAASNIVTARSGETVNLTGMTIKWQAGKEYSLTDWVVPTTLADHVYKCVQAGISGAVEPTWGTTVDGDTTDGTVKWRCYKKDILFTGYAEKRIYRSITGDTSSGYYRIATIPMTEESYSDSVSDATAVLGAQLTTSDHDPPPDDLIGLFSMGSYLVGWRSASKELCFSKPNYPYAWPEAYRRNMDSTIVAAGGVGTTIIVATEENPAVLVGSAPATMAQKRLAEARPCLSKRGFVMFPQGAVWPVAQGLYFTDGVTGKIFTEKSINRAEWEAYHPDTMQAMEFDGAYLAFYKYGSAEGAILIDLVDGVLMPLSLYTTAAFVDQQEQKLYYVKKTVVAEGPDTNQVMEWEGDETQNFASFAWESKDFIEAKRARLCCGRVEFEPGDLTDYWETVIAYQETLRANTEKIAAYDLGSIVPQGGFDLGAYGPADDDLEPLGEPPAYAGDLSLQLKVYSDDVLRKTIDLYHTGIFKFDGGDARHKWKYRLEGNVDRVKSVYLASTVSEIKNAKNGG